ncbi:MAG: hypothetical protein AABX23_03175 [Nanoarchaeota archaeon]
MSRQGYFHRAIAKRHQVPFMLLVDGLKRYIEGGEFSVEKGATASVRRFFLQAYEFAKVHGNLPELGERYQVLGSNKRSEIAIPSMFKLKELYERTEGQEELDERQVGLAAVRFLGLLDNLEENPDVNKKERRQYKTLLQFGQTLIQDPECQEVNLGNEDDE